jgi:hypothetical protein
MGFDGIIQVAMGFLSGPKTLDEMINFRLERVMGNITGIRFNLRQLQPVF